MLEKLNIHWVAYYIHRGKEVLRDLVTIKRDEFLNWLETAKVLPTTASPGPGDYMAKYEELIDGGASEIISIHITSKGSGAYQAAKVAQETILEQNPEVKIEVIDTQTVALCQGWMVIEAARAVQEGKSFTEIIDIVKGLIPVSKMIQTADTLKYLYMGGRIGRAQTLIGSLLNIKPLIGMADGVIVPLGKVRSRIQAYHAMVDMICQDVGEKGEIKIAYVHAGAQKEMEKIRELVENRLTVVEAIFAELSPALAVHSGPGTTGVCYYPVSHSK